MLFSGQDELPVLVSAAGTWSLSALALLIVFKGLAYSISLGSFRGGPTFPAMFLGAAAGIMLSHLPGFPMTAGVAVGIGVGVVSILRLPLSAIVIASLLTDRAGAGAEPLIIIGVVVAYLTTLALSRLQATRSVAERGRRPMIRRLAITWVFNTIALFSATWLLSGLSYGSDWWALLGAGFVFTLANFFLKPVLTILSSRSSSSRSASSTCSSTCSCST